MKVKYGIHLRVNNAGVKYNRKTIKSLFAGSDSGKHRIPNVNCLNVRSGIRVGKPGHSIAKGVVLKMNRIC